MKIEGNPRTPSRAGSTLFPICITFSACQSLPVTEKNQQLSDTGQEKSKTVNKYSEVKLYRPVSTAVIATLSG